MRLVCFEYDGTRRAGVVEDDAVADMENAAGDLLPVIQAGGKLSGLDVKTLRETGCSVRDISQVKLCAPIERPPKIVCVGGNYGKHLKEAKSSGTDRDVFSKDTGGSRGKKPPILFAKAANSVIGPGDKIIIPEESKEVDYEVELGVVIGGAGFKLTSKQARKRIFGYTVLNDVTARDLQRTESQWYRAKGFATFCPIGPAVVTADAIDPGNLNLELAVNGELRQKSNTKHMMYDVYDLVALISHVTPLEPGDVIGTGTPEGVGAFMDPPVYLEPGDVVTAVIEGIGTLENEVA